MRRFGDCLGFRGCGPDDEADTARRVARRMQHLSPETAPAQRVAFRHEIPNSHGLGCWNAEPLRLHVEAVIERQIGFVDQDRRARDAMELGESANVVDVGVSADDRQNLEVMTADDFEDSINVVTGIDDDGFACFRVAQNGAVALQHAHGNDFVDEFGGHRRRVYPNTLRRGARRSHLLVGWQSGSDERLDTSEELRTLLHRVGGGVDGGTKAQSDLAGMNDPLPPAKEVLSSGDRDWHDVNSGFNCHGECALFERTEASVRAASSFGEDRE